MEKVFREKYVFNGRHFHLFLCNKSVSATGLHSHDYYEYTLVLSGRYYQEVNGKRVLLERGDYIFMPLGSQHESFYDFGVTRMLNISISRDFFDAHYLPLLSPYFVASQPYRVNREFLSYIESVLGSSDFREEMFSEFVELVTFYIINHIRHYKETLAHEDIPAWLQQTMQGMRDKNNFADGAIKNMVMLSGKTQEYLTRATKRFYDKTPMQLINEIRVNYAKTQLEISKLSVADIAFESGYNDTSLFIKNFKKITSFTPGNYRKRYFDIDVDE